MMYPIIHGIVAQVGIAPPGPAWALWLMNEGSGQTVYDNSGNGRDLWLGTDGTSETYDPAWASVGGVACLEFSGGQICKSKTAFTLSQPFTAVMIIRRVSFYSVACFATTAYRPIYITTDTTLRAYLGATLGDGTTPATTWISPQMVANGTSSVLTRYGQSDVVGNMGTQGISGLLLGAHYDAVYKNFFSGQIAAMVIVQGALSRADRDAWSTYLASVKGITL